MRVDPDDAESIARQTSSPRRSVEMSDQHAELISRGRPCVP